MTQAPILYPEKAPDRRSLLPGALCRIKGTPCCDMVEVAGVEPASKDFAVVRSSVSSTVIQDGHLHLSLLYSRPRYWS